MKQKLTHERDFQDYARLLKNFYGEFQSYAIINGIFVLVWLLAGGGYFWPIWPIVIWGASLFLKASKLGVVDSTFYDQCHAFREKMPFFKQGWEEKKVEELIKKARAAGKDVKKATEKAGDMLAQELGVVKEFGDKTIVAGKEKAGEIFESAKHAAHDTKEKLEKVAEKAERAMKAGVKAAKTEFNKSATKAKPKASGKKAVTGKKDTLIKTAAKAAPKAGAVSKKPATKKPAAPKK